MKVHIRYRLDIMEPFDPSDQEAHRALQSLSQCFSAAEPYSTLFVCVFPSIEVSTYVVLDNSRDK